MAKQIHKCGLDAKAASASTAAPLALSAGGRECGGGSTLAAYKEGFFKGGSRVRVAA
jgi:hypothetical protein